ncbi:MAG: hypothetical protein B7Z37_24075 [Verrucomicrobia bacterium 12-59-8]|nr:MAG: hypothetical protein B7Z37_24075 [Verrucomicrobia bacterium 12-59-8]
MDLRKLGLLLIGGSAHGLCWWALKPASLAGDVWAMVAYAALLLSGLFVLGAFLSPSPDCATVIETADTPRTFD